jgi:hypothetical protein
MELVSSVILDAFGLPYLPPLLHFDILMTLYQLRRSYSLEYSVCMALHRHFRGGTEERREKCQHGGSRTKLVLAL